MDFFSDAPLALSLTGLALLDALSIGTLLIPLFLLLAPRLRGGRVLLYLLTIAGFYLLVGALILLGVVNVAEFAQGFFVSTPGRVLRLLIGVGLLITSFLIPTGKPAQGGERERALAHERDGAPAAYGSPDQHDGTQGAGGTAAAYPGAATTERPLGRVARWRERLLAPSSSPATIMAVAIAAGLVEVATMLPYLVGMGLVAEAGLAPAAQFAALAGYCLVMIVPALVLLALRVLAAPLVQRPLERLASWLERSAGETTAWIIGIVGFLVARSAAAELGLFALLGELTPG